MIYIADSAEDFKWSGNSLEIGLSNAFGLSIKALVDRIIGIETGAAVGEGTQIMEEKEAYVFQRRTSGFAGLEHFN
jgi:hypothetical protein